MQRIVIRLSRQVKRQFRRTISRIKDAKLKTRYLIILHTAQGYSRRQIAKMLLCSSSTVDRIRRRFVEEGELGLVNHRGDSEVLHQWQLPGAATNSSFNPLLRCVYEVKWACRYEGRHRAIQGHSC